MSKTVSFEELIAQGYRRWYRYGWRSPRILYKRFRNRHRWGFRLRMAKQRAVRGYSDDQLWNLNSALATLTVAGVKAMREWAHSYPAEFAEPPHGDGTGWETWDGILARIEEGFQAWLDEDGWFHDKPEAEAKFNDAMGLYAHWFGALWD